MSTHLPIYETLTASDGCTRCPLHRGRQRVVPGAGDPQARLVFVGEAPGREEDAQGLPFVGAAGQLLDRMLAAMSPLSPYPLTRDRNVFVTNVVRCRPPQNRTPEIGEVAQCSPYLWNTLRALPQARVVVALGNTPLRHLSGDPAAKITYRRGLWISRVLDGRTLRIMPTFHPAYLLRSPADKDLAWADLQEVVAELRRLS